jgi:hypothetical protein
VQTGRGARKCPRVPVFLDVRCDLDSGARLKGKIIDLSTEGISAKFESPIAVTEKVTVEFLLPNTLSSIDVAGEVVWYRLDPDAKGDGEDLHLVGIKFVNLENIHRNLICGHSLKMLHDEDLILQQGVDRVLSDIRNLPPIERQRALDILVQKGLVSNEEKPDLGLLDE